MLPRQLQICEKLGFVDWENLLHALKLQHYLLTNNQVHLESTIQLQAFVRDGEIDLTFKSQTTQVQFVAQALFVG